MRFLLVEVAVAIQEEQALVMAQAERIRSSAGHLEQHQSSQPAAVQAMRLAEVVAVEVINRLLWRLRHLGQRPERQDLLDLQQ